MDGIRAPAAAPCSLAPLHSAPLPSLSHGGRPPARRAGGLQCGRRPAPRRTSGRPPAPLPSPGPWLPPPAATSSNEPWRWARGGVGVAAVTRSSSRCAAADSQAVKSGAGSATRGRWRPGSASGRERKAPSRWARGAAAARSGAQAGQPRRRSARRRPDRARPRGARPARLLHRRPALLVLAADGRTWRRRARTAGHCEQDEVFTCGSSGGESSGGGVESAGRRRVSSANQHYNKPFSWKAPAIILAFEFLESIAYAGIALNLVVYLGTVLHGTTASNAANVDAWNGATFLTPVLGAFLADTYWGKYKTVTISIVFYVVGLLVITASAVIPYLQPASCEGSSCPPATGFQYFVLFASLYLISIGTGGVKSALLPLGADQYNDSVLEESKNKQLFFSWFFISINLGVFISGTAVVWIQQNVAWSLGFGISLICLVIATVAFLLGTPFYRVQLPTGSPLKSIVMVFVASFKKRRVTVPADSTLLFEGDDAESSNTVPNKIEHTDEFRCLDKAAVVLEDQEIKDSHRPWLLCTVTQVEEVKILIRMLPIWFTCVFYSAALCQTATTFVQQGNAMNTKIGSFSVPAASLNSAEVIFMMIWVAFQDSVVIPIARKYTGNPAGLTLLQRMGVGRLLAVPALASAALVEAWRLRSVRAGGNLSIGWQLPQFVILACSDVFCGIAQLEFFYSEAPASMRSLCSAFSFLAMSLAYYVNTLVVTVVAAVTRAGGGQGWLPADLNDGHLDYYFWLWTGISAVNYVVYTAFAKRYTVKKVVRQ